MQPEPSPVVFRAYDERQQPSLRAVRLGELLSEWVRNEVYAVTAGLAEDTARPANILPVSDALRYVSHMLPARQPLYLWRYPLSLELQLWTSGWELRVAPRWLQTRHFSQRRELLRTLQHLVAHMDVDLLVGPARRPPISVRHALPEYDRWPILYLGARLYQAFAWKSVLDERQVIMLPWAQGLWVEQGQTKGWRCVR